MHCLDAGLDDLAVVVAHFSRYASGEVLSHRLADMRVVIAEHMVEVSEQDSSDPLAALALLDVAHDGLDFIDVVADGGGQVQVADLQVERLGGRRRRDLDRRDGPSFSVSYFSWQSCESSAYRYRRAEASFTMSVDERYMSLSSRYVLAPIVARDDLLQADDAPTIRAAPSLQYLVNVLDALAVRVPGPGPKGGRFRWSRGRRARRRSRRSC